jgi:hypothetical protein
MLASPPRPPTLLEQSPERLPHVMMLSYSFSLSRAIRLGWAGHQQTDKWNQYKTGMIEGARRKFSLDPFGRSFPEKARGAESILAGCGV